MLVSGRILGGVLACFAIVLPAALRRSLLGFISLQIVQLPALLGIFLGTALCASGIGAIIGTCVKGSRYVAFLSSMTAIYLFLLGGGFTVMELVPHWLQTLSAFIPTRYSVDALRQALFYPNPTGLPFSLLILAIYAIASVGIGAFLMRRSWNK
jgi:ABC-type multidrug transport system permease subunit